MKKKYLFSFLILLAVAIAMAFVGFANISSTDVAFAATTSETTSEEPTLTLYDYISISQDGHNFTQDDFEEEVIAGVSYYNLFTNKTVTISLNATLATGDYFIVSENIDGVVTPISASDPRILVLNGVTRYVFDTVNLTEDTATKLNIKYTKANPISQSNPQGLSTVYSLNLNIIQVKSNFSTSDDFKWDYTLSGAAKQVSAPSIGYEYPPLTLSVPNGTMLNPTTIKFIYCGETYEIYNIAGKYYNAIDNTELDFSNLSFSLSGTYSVEIYDKTAISGYSNCNHVEYDFTIENNDSSNRYAPFYINATIESGEQLMNNQISNEKTTLEFVNLNSIKNYVDRIIVLKSYRPTGGQNITERTDYAGDQLPSSLSFDTDGTYHIQVIGINNGNIIKEFEFILIDSIRSFFEVDGTRYEIATTEPSNITKTVPVERTVESTYNGILGKTTYTFNVIIARSSPSINGVNNNARTSKDVTISVNGVGNIDVVVTQDGKTSNLTLKNGDTIGTFSEPGKYFIKITDEMGTTVTKSFTLTIQMNTAAIALIIIGVAIVLIIIVYAIVSRSRVKVR